MLHTLILGPMDNFVYIISDPYTQYAAIVDPSWDAGSILKFLQIQALTLTDILLTHSHYDHCNALQPVIHSIPKARIHISRAEAEFWGNAPAQCILHEEGDVIPVGILKVTVLHTPGHTPGSVCYQMDNYLFTGDTLFINGCGRCDLEGGDPQQMHASLQRLARLPPDLFVCAGHDYGPQPMTTLAEQVATNPFLKISQLNDFIKYRQSPF